MENIIGSCVICAQNLFVDNFSSLLCGHTFHFECILKWLSYSEQCPTCRACTSPKHIVKRLYFAKCGDKAMNGIESSTAATSQNNKFASTENALSSRTSENFYGNCHGVDESCNNVTDYDSDSEGSSEHEWAMSIIRIDGDSSKNGNDSNTIALGRNESVAGSEAENEEELEYHETISNADMASAIGASFNDTSSITFGTLSEIISEIDSGSIFSVNHNNMGTSDSFDDHEEFDDDSGNTYTSLSLTEHNSDDGHDNSGDDNNSSGSEEMSDSVFFVGSEESDDNDFFIDSEENDNDCFDFDESNDSNDDCDLSE